MWPRQILRAVKVGAIWWDKEPCSFKHSFRYSGARLWNGLPANVKNANNLFFFKNSMVKHIKTKTYLLTFRREDKFSSFIRSSPDLKYPPVFSWLLYVHVPLKWEPCAFRPTKLDAIRSNRTADLWSFESLTQSKSRRFLLQTLF